MPVDDSSKFADKFLVKSSRLINWDYSTPGIYFITICTFNHNKFLGKIVNGQMVLSDRGAIVKQELIKTINLRSEIESLGWVIMPNHFHWIIRVLVETPRGASLHNNRPVTLINYRYKNHPGYYLRLNQKSKQIIPKIINQFKSSVKRICNQQHLFFAWQPQFYDEIIKDKNRFYIVKKYIQNNPKNWEKDEYNR